MSTTATIDYHGGQSEVENFERIEELNSQQTIRVYHHPEVKDVSHLRGPNEEGLYYEDYQRARISSVNPDTDQNEDEVIGIDA